MMRRRLAIYLCMMTAGIAAGYFIFEKIAFISGSIFLASSEIAICFCIPKEERIKCGLVMILGFLIFAGSYGYLESCPPPGEVLEGRVLRAEDKGDYLRLTIKEEGSGRRFTAEIDHSPDEESPCAEITGMIIKAHGNAKDIRPADNPGCFNYKIYMRSLNVSYGYKIIGFEIKEGGSETLWRIRRALIRSRERFLDNFDEESGAFLRGVIFGDKSEIDEDTLEEFNINSSGHILAVSGLHIGFLYALLKLLSSGKKTWFISFLIIIILIIYGEMSLWSASTVRAVIVLSLSILSINFMRDFDLLTALAASAFLILIIRPYMLFNSGFQLSYAALGSIAFLARRVTAYAGELLGVAVAVQIGTLPIIAMSYQRINLMAFLINVPIILLSSLLVPVCILSLMIFIMLGNLPQFIYTGIAFLSESLILINRKLSLGGLLSNLAAGIKPGFVILIYLSIIFISSEWFRIQLIRRNYQLILRSIAFLILPVLMIQTALYDSFMNDEIVFAAVGQGDCVHIRDGKTDILIDGGGSDFINIGEKTLMPYLLSQGAQDVDMAILTHLHTDHYLGISQLSDKYPVKSFAMPSDYKESFEKDNSIAFKSKSIIYLEGGSVISLSNNVYVEVLWPLEGKNRSISIDDPNEHNMVYMIHYNPCRRRSKETADDIKIMITGDLLEEDEYKMVKAYSGSDKLKCDILKVAHHGSKSSSSEAFLNAASPEYAIIQVGRNNFYGHPHAQTITRLEERGIKSYRTDLHGAVGIDISKRSGRIKAHSMHN